MANSISEKGLGKEHKVKVVNFPGVQNFTFPGISLVTG